MTGVDITPAYIQYAAEQAQKEHLKVTFLCSDIREVAFENEFDVVLNMADGAIRYLENDSENSRIFLIIARALKPGGRHFMDIMNADYADSHFPCKLWDAGEKCLTLSSFEWNVKTRTLLYGQVDVPYGVPLPKPDMQEGNSIRLYSRKEIKQIFGKNGMAVLESFADLDGTPSSENGIQLMVLSQKTFQTDARRSADPKLVLYCVLFICYGDALFLISCVKRPVLCANHWPQNAEAVL